DAAIVKPATRQIPATTESNARVRRQAPWRAINLFAIDRILFGAYGLRGKGASGGPSQTKTLIHTEVLPGTWRLLSASSPISTSEPRTSNAIWVTTRRSWARRSCGA